MHGANNGTPQSFAIFTMLELNPPIDVAGLCLRLSGYIRHKTHIYGLKLVEI